MTRLGNELRFIRSAYLEMSLRVVKLQSLQAGIVYQLDEARPRKSMVRQNQRDRDQLLAEIAHHLDALGGIGPQHRAAIGHLRDNVAFFDGRFDDVGTLYTQAFAPDTLPTDKEAHLSRARRIELELVRRIKRWGTELRDVIDDSTRRLELAEEKARLGAIVLGAIATLVGLLVTVGAVLTLRPLRRLRDGAMRVAGGDYAQRVQVQGDNEVAEVAREFNAMASAIEEREQELVRAARLAAVGKMASVITHEVRNPLSSIGLNAELLEEEIRAQGNDEALALCRAIHKEVDRLTAITEEYLGFARMPKGRLDVADLNALVTDVVEFQREELSLMGVSLETTLAPGPLPVPMDEAQLRQALLNLVRNGAEAMQPKKGGPLTIVTQRDADAVSVHVVDEGSGIDPVDQPRILETFFSTKERGTGLGLPLVHQIVSEHGGRLSFESKVGAGTTFTIRLPLAA